MKSDSLKLAVFDLDGTLNQTHLYCLAAQRKALAELGVNTPYSDAELMDCIGNRSVDYVPRLLPGRSPADQARYLERELFWEERFMSERCACYPGIPQLLERLDREGIKTAVCSNSTLRYIYTVLQGIGILQNIHEIQPLLPGMDKQQTLAKLLCQLKPTAAVMVGDRIFDREAAAANGLPFVGCAYGYAPKEVEGADFVAQTPATVYHGIRLLLGE